MTIRRLALVLRLVSVLLLFTSVALAQNLELHYINVGWGASVLVKGPNGTTVLRASSEKTPVSLRI